MSNAKNSMWHSGVVDCLSHVWLCNPMDCSFPRLLCPKDFPCKNTRVGCHFLLQGFFPTRNWTCISCIGRWILYHWTTWEAHVTFSIVQSPSCVWLFVTPWTAAHQASLSLTISRSLPEFMSIALVMPFSHLILWCPLFLHGWLPRHGEGAWATQWS